MKSRLVLACALILGLAGCTLLPERQPSDVYRLPTALPDSTPASLSPQETPWSLRVLRPSSSSQTAGRRIIVIPEDQRVSIYAGSAWTDPAPSLMRQRILDAVRADGRVPHISSGRHGLHAEFELDSDLRAFHSEYRNGLAHAVIRLDARLVDTESRRILASRSFSTHRASSDNEVASVVQAFGTAADRIGVEIADWIITQGNALTGEKGPAGR